MAVESGLESSKSGSRKLIRSRDSVFWLLTSVFVTFESIDARAEPAVPVRLLLGLVRLGREPGATFAVIDEGKRGLLYLEGRLTRELEPGTYGFWNTIAAPRIERLKRAARRWRFPARKS